MKIIFFDSKSYDKQSFEKFIPEGMEAVFFEDRLSTHTVALAAGADALCLFVNDALTPEVIDKLLAQNVKLIALRCAGFNNIDLAYLNKRIPVVRVPAYSPHAVAEHALALMLCLNRKIHKAYHRVREGNFSLKGLTGFDFYKKTAGVVGTGKIGQAMLQVLSGLGMKLLAYDLYPNPQIAENIGFSYVSLEELWQSCQLISLHCPLSKDTYHLINAQSIAQMRQGVTLINTGRGALVDTVALIEGLRQEKIGAAGLDVYEEEADYFFEDHSDSNLTDEHLLRLLSFHNVIITSHQAFLTDEALAKIAQTTIHNIVSYLERGELNNQVE